MTSLDVLCHYICCIYTREGIALADTVFSLLACLVVTQKLKFSILSYGREFCDLILWFLLLDVFNHLNFGSFSKSCLGLFKFSRTLYLTGLLNNLATYLICTAELLGVVVKFCNIILLMKEVVL